MKTSSQKTSVKFSFGRYILIIGAALILAILLYALLQVTDKAEPTGTDAIPIPGASSGSVIGVQPASFQQISEFRDGENQRLRLSGKAEPEAIVVITNRGERLRQVRVNELGQWGVTLDVEDESMALEAQLYMEEGEAAIRSEETVFRLPVSEAAPGAEQETEPSVDMTTETKNLSGSAYKTSALIMVTAPGSPSRLIQSPFGGSPSSGPLTISVIDYDASGGVIITGTSSLPGRIAIFAQGTQIGETGIGVGGRWNFIASRLLPRAKVELTAILIPAEGVPNAPDERISVSVPFTFLPVLQEEDTDGSGALSLYIDPEQWQVRRTLIGGGGQSTVVFAPQIQDSETVDPPSE